MTHLVSGVLERLIRRLKRQESYKLDVSLSGSQLSCIMLARGCQFARGLLVRPFLRASHGTLFIGRGVGLRHRRQLTLGGAVTLDDYCFIDALSLEGISLGHGVSIGRNSELRGSGVIGRPGTGIRIDDNVGIAPGCYLGGQGGIIIEPDVIVGPGVMIVTEDHVYVDPKRPIRDQGEIRRAVVIKRNTWIGGRAIVLSGVTIGENVVVAAGAVVTRDVPARCVVAGVPARVIKGPDARLVYKSLSSEGR